MTNPLVPFVIYPQGPETQDEDTGKEEKTIRKTNVARYQALLRVDMSKLLLIANLAAFFWHDLPHPMNHVSDSLELIFGPGFVQRVLTFSARRGQPQSPEQGLPQGKGPRG